MQSILNAPTMDDIRKAAQRIKAHAHQTPVMTSQSLNELTECKLLFKCENFQRVGAFKFRGALNSVFSLSEKEIALGVVTHSSGNHGQALALAASLRKIPAYIVMPRTSPQVKIDAVKKYGGEIIFSETAVESREEKSKEVIEKTGATFIHPFNDSRVIAGQGTCALEFLTSHPDIEIIMAPVGGGGLLSGTSIATANLSPNTLIIGAEPLAVDDAHRSLIAGKIMGNQNSSATIADGLRTGLSPLTFQIIKNHVSKILTAKEASIVDAMRLIWERMKIIVEPSSAVPLAALLENPSVFKGKTVGIIVTGGNLDLNSLPWML